MRQDHQGRVAGVCAVPPLCPSACLRLCVEESVFVCVRVCVFVSESSVCCVCECLRVCECVTVHLRAFAASCVAQTYMARMEGEGIKEELRQARLLLIRKIVGATHFQRLYRGHMARTMRRRLEAAMREMIRQTRGAVIIQCAVRQRLAWREAERRRQARELARRNR